MRNEKVSCHTPKLQVLMVHQFWITLRSLKERTSQTFQHRSPLCFWSAMWPAVRLQWKCCKRTGNFELWPFCWDGCTDNFDPSSHPIEVLWVCRLGRQSLGVDCITLAGRIITLGGSLGGVFGEAAAAPPVEGLGGGGGNGGGWPPTACQWLLYACGFLARQAWRGFILPRFLSPGKRPDFFFLGVLPGLARMSQEFRKCLL